MVGDMRMGATSSGPVWDKTGENLFILTTSEGKTSLNKISTAGEKEVIYDENNHVYGFAYDEVQEQFIVAISTPTEQGDFYLLEKDVAKPKRLTKANPFLEDIQLNEPEELSITAQDGWHIQAWLMKQIGRASCRERVDGQGEGRV